MTEQQAPAPAGRSAPYPRAASQADLDPTSGPWGGWVRFGGVLMAVVGAFGVVEGLAALFAPTTYVQANGVVVALTFNGWGWLHIILGALVLVVGLGLLREEVPGWARGTAIVLVSLNAIVQLTWLPAYPIWSIVMVVLDILIITSLVAIADRGAWS